MITQHTANAGATDDKKSRVPGTPAQVAATPGASPAAPAAASGQPVPTRMEGADQKSSQVKAKLRARVGDEVFQSWFKSIEVDRVEGKVATVSVPVKFLRNWIQTHYTEDLFACCASEFPGIERVDVVLREPPPVARPVAAPVVRDSSRDRDAGAAPVAAGRRSFAGAQAQPGLGRTHVGDLEGSPLDPRYTFDSFVVSSSNRIAHAGATQVAETLFGYQRGFNPLFIYASVGLGKTHLLHAIAWEVKRRFQHAQLLYLTAERFRYQFVQALRSQDPLAFKNKFSAVDILLIDDLEFLNGPQTEQEFDHTINMLLDGGKQLILAASKAPNQIDKLNDRMRSRLQRGLVTEIGGLDYELRLKVLERRVYEKRQLDPSFEMAREVLQLIAERLTESGRELEGAVNRLHATWQYMRTPITLDLVETVIRDLVQGSGESRRIKIEDILKVVSRHFGVPKGEILSQRRHRSVVWPRQIGMYLAKQLTARSLPEIGRRFGNRDHTTVLHAIRKIEGELEDNTRLKDDLEELKKQLNM